MEYRPFPDERVDEFRAFMRYAFAPADGPYDPDEETGHETIADRRGLFNANGDPVAVCAHHDLSLRIRGADREVAGLSAVASPPEHRRQGNIGRLLRKSLSEYREQGIHFSALWPFEYSFYRNYGWATASRYRRFTTPPEQLAFVDDLGGIDADRGGDEGDSDADRGGDERIDGETDGDTTAGTVRRLGANDYPAIRPLLAAIADRYDLTMDWTEAWWRERVLQGWKSDPFVYGWECDGELRGICAYTFEDDGDADDTVMRVSDIAVADDEAWFQLLRFLRNHDSQVAEIRVNAPPDAPLLDLVDDPRAVTCEIRTGPMFRLVDVAAALDADGMAPEPEVEAAFSLAVDDPLVEWNDGTFRVAIADGAVTVDGGNERDPAAVRIDVGTLSQLYVGYTTVDEAIRSGGLEIDPDVDDDAGLEDTLRALFPPRPTHLRERF